VDRIFLDANVLFSAAYRTNSRLVGLWSLRDVELLTCAYAAEEARVNLIEPQQQERLEKLLKAVRIVPDQPSGNLPRDVTLPAKDLPIIFAAVSARATHLLTGDRQHFGNYFGRRIRGVLVSAPSEYFKRKKG